MVSELGTRDVTQLCGRNRTAPLQTRGLSQAVAECLQASIATGFRTGDWLLLKVTDNAGRNNISNNNRVCELVPPGGLLRK
jgi:hypothetical protein